MNNIVILAHAHARTHARTHIHNYMLYGLYNKNICIYDVHILEPIAYTHI